MLDSRTLPELLDFLPQEKRQIPRTAAFPKQGKISLEFPLDFLAGKPKNTGSVNV